MISRSLNKRSSFILLFCPAILCHLITTLLGLVKALQVTNKDNYSQAASLHKALLTCFYMLQRKKNITSRWVFGSSVKRHGSCIPRPLHQFSLLFSRTHDDFKHFLSIKCFEKKCQGVYIAPNRFLNVLKTYSTVHEFSSVTFFSISAL